MIHKMWKFVAAALLLAATASASAADLPLGSGDVLKITVYDHPDLTLDTRVSETGTITFPLLGEVAVAGISVAQAQKKIAYLLDNGKFIHDAHVNILVTLMQSQQVSVLGQVNRPGRYPIDGRHSVLDLLALAGGVSVDAGDTATLIRNSNNKAEKEVIDITDIVRSGDLKMNVELQGGDILFVERTPRFYIYGEVQHAGAYRLERNMTVLQALSVGGGLTQRGTERGVRIKRRDASGELRDISVKQGDQVKPDDIIYVQESLF